MMPADAPRSDPENAGVPWRRPDGQLRVLVHLDGCPAAEPVETRAERLRDWLDVRVPGWDDWLALLAGGLFVLLVGLLAILL